ncbi:hypothetical protein ACFLY7_01135 [Patescibacteria group bacterium]
MESRYIFSLACFLVLACYFLVFFYLGKKTKNEQDRLCDLVDKQLEHREKTFHFVDGSEIRDLLIEFVSGISLKKDKIPFVILGNKVFLNVCFSNENCESQIDIFSTQDVFDVLVWADIFETNPKVSSMKKHEINKNIFVCGSDNREMVLSCDGVFSIVDIKIAIELRGIMRGWY